MTCYQVASRVQKCKDVSSLAQHRPQGTGNTTKEDEIKAEEMKAEGENMASSGSSRRSWCPGGHRPACWGASQFKVWSALSQGPVVITPVGRCTAKQYGVTEAQWLLCSTLVSFPWSLQNIRTSYNPMNLVQDLDLNAASAPFQPAVGFSLPNCPLVLLYILRTLTMGDEREVSCPTY